MVFIYLKIFLKFKKWYFPNFYHKVLNNNVNSGSTLLTYYEQYVIAVCHFTSVSKNTSKRNPTKTQTPDGSMQCYEQRSFYSDITTNHNVLHHNHTNYNSNHCTPDCSILKLQNKNSKCSKQYNVGILFLRS